MDDHAFMKIAIDEGAMGLAEGGVPVGAALVADGKVLGAGHNRRVQQGSVIRHGETDCLENVGRLHASVYRRATMYTTLSPCAMCSGAMVLYGIPRVIAGENHSFVGEEAWLRDRGVTMEVVQDADCVALMTEFMRAHPELWNEDIGE